MEILFVWRVSYSLVVWVLGSGYFGWGFLGFFIDIFGSCDFIIFKIIL